MAGTKNNKDFAVVQCSIYLWGVVIKADRWIAPLKHHNKEIRLNQELIKDNDFQPIKQYVYTLILSGFTKKPVDYISAYKTFIYELSEPKLLIMSLYYSLFLTDKNSELIPEYRLVSVIF